jgi:hypothetical protein
VFDIESLLTFLFCCFVAITFFSRIYFRKSSKLPDDLKTASLSAQEKYKVEYVTLRLKHIFDRYDEI